MKVEVSRGRVSLLLGLDPLYGETLEKRLDTVILLFLHENATRLEAVKRLPGVNNA